MESVAQAPGTRHPSPRLHSFITLKPTVPISGNHQHGRKILSPTQPTRHLSPQKFYAQQQQQRQAVLRNMLPLLPIKHQVTYRSPPSPASIEPVPWNPAWLPFPMETIPVVNAKSIGGTGLSLGSASLDAWLESFDRDVLQYESLEAFVQVKLPEALAFCHKMEQQLVEMEEQERQELAAARTQQTAQRLGLGRGFTRSSRHIPHKHRATSAMTRFPIRFRVAVFASLVERAITAMTQSAALAHLKPWLLQARQELFRAMFADYDHYSMPRTMRRRKSQTSVALDQASERTDDGIEEDDEDTDTTSDDESNLDESPSTEAPRQSPDVVEVLRHGPEAPRPLSFFLSRVPFILKLQDETQRRATRFQRHQVVLRRIVQSLYRSLGSVFHAWKTYTRQRREERLNDKGAQLTAMVVIQRGLVRTIFVEWSKCTLKTKLARAYEREAHAKRVHEDRVNELYKELFVLREQNTRLVQELEEMRRKWPPIQEGEHRKVEAVLEETTPDSATIHEEEN